MVEAVHDVMALHHGMEPKGLVVVGSWTSALTLVHENTTLPTKPKAKGRRFMLCQCVLTPGQIRGLLHETADSLRGMKAHSKPTQQAWNEKNNTSGLDLWQGSMQGHTRTAMQRSQVSRASLWVRRVLGYSATLAGR